VECLASSFPRSWASTGAISLGLQSREKDYNDRRHEEKTSHGGNLDNLTQRMSHRATLRRPAASTPVHAQSRAEVWLQELFSEVRLQAEIPPRTRPSHSCQPDQTTTAARHRNPYYRGHAPASLSCSGQNATAAGARQRSRGPWRGLRFDLSRGEGRTVIVDRRHRLGFDVSRRGGLAVRAHGGPLGSSFWRRLTPRSANRVSPGNLLPSSGVSVGNQRERFQ
jgi:hypothetical protein